MLDDVVYILWFLVFDDIIIFMGDDEEHLLFNLCGVTVLDDNGYLVIIGTMCQVAQMMAHAKTYRFFLNTLLNIRHKLKKFMAKR